ncbi:MAG: hypothetical protein N2C14_01385, partial [Planctomycetales bacterium]
SIQLENMRRCADAGAVLLPAMPAFYHEPRSIQDLVDFVVSRICDQLGVSNDLIQRWGKQNDGKRKGKNPGKPDDQSGDPNKKKK